MLFILGLVIVSAAIVILRKFGLASAGNAAPLGWMSEQWLTEHRASHLP